MPLRLIKKLGEAIREKIVPSRSHAPSPAAAGRASGHRAAQSDRRSRPAQDAGRHSQPPADVDYDRWLGPAPEHPFNKLRFHKTWRMFSEYGNGEIGDDGICHVIDPNACEDAGCCEEAADECPEGAISIE